MYNSKSAILCLALLMAFVEIGSCLKCYHCIPNDENDWNCTSSINSWDCESNNSTTFGEKNLYNILPADLFGNANDTKYCHSIEMDSGTKIYTCLGIKNNDTTKTCDEMKNSHKPDHPIKSCMACDTDNCNLAEMKVVENTVANNTVANNSTQDNKGNNGSQAFMSVRLTGLTLVIAYLLYKQ